MRDSTVKGGDKPFCPTGNPRSKKENRNVKSLPAAL